MALKRYRKPSVVKSQARRQTTRKVRLGLDFVEPKKVEKEEKISKTITIDGALSVKDFAAKTELPVTEVISTLMKNGMLATVNDLIDIETAQIIGDELGVKVDEESAEDILDKPKTNLEVDTSKLVTRPPVVTIMGHVDHGKTTLLDKIRETHVVESESGGITQHISAYQVKFNSSKNKNLGDRTITFIDTPGHAAFSSLRSHGAAITDIVVLIVAANDGVKPQTVEVIEQAKKHNVPIIVAINKVDLPGADVMKVKQQLGEYELVPEEWGGKTVMVEVSALTGKGIDNLLEMILLQADIMDLKADRLASAVGIVIEAHMHKGAGALALILVENGTLHRGDFVQIGDTWGKVRILENFTGESIESASPSCPVRVAGLKSVPEFGERLVVFESEREAKDAASMIQKRTTTAHFTTAKKISEDEEGEEKITDFPLVVKADVTGSLEALKKMILAIKTPGLNTKIVADGVGAISESDISIAKATGAKVVGFRVNILGLAKKIAEKDTIEIIQKSVIYEVEDELKKIISDVLPPVISEEKLGEGKILAIFREDKKGTVIGAKLDDGKASRGDEIKILQDGNEKWRGKVITLRREKNEVSDIDAGTEFGIGLEPYAKVANGDSIEIFVTKSEKRVV
jgi:translation initiation factor IF-2